MIIQLRGTSGSGKSTAVREVMARYGQRIPVFIAGRKQPLGYYCTHPQGGRTLAVVGHYEVACGGCDTIPSYDRTIELVRKAHGDGNDVLFEGLIMSSESRRCSAMANDGLPYRVLALDTPIELCLAGVNARRRAKDPNKPDVDPKNTIGKIKVVQNAMVRLASLGVEGEWVTRETVVPRIMGLFNAA